MTDTRAVGIIANPFSGRDIRRLVAYGSVMDNMSKVRILQRLMAGIVEAGVRQIYYMPDPVSLVPTAFEGMQPGDRAGARISPVLELIRGESGETAEAAARMARLGVGAVVTLGGDGTNRLVAGQIGQTPLMPLSTGTNNTFPASLEPTIAGLATGKVARDGPGPGCRREKLIRLFLGAESDIALVDLAVLHGSYLGAGAVWEPEAIRELVVTQGTPTAIGLSAIAGRVCPVDRQGPFGAHIRLGSGESIRAPIGPGKFASLRVAAAERIACGEVIQLTEGPGLLALDGERLWTIPSGVRAQVTLSDEGPVVIDPARVLA